MSTKEYVESRGDYFPLLFEDIISYRDETGCLYIFTDNLEDISNRRLEGYRNKDVGSVINPQFQLNRGSYS